MTTNQITDLTPRDREILATLQDELPPHDYTAAFARALQLGASPQLLRDIASGYVGRDPNNQFRMVGLPYIDVLLANDWDAAQVRLFVVSMFTKAEIGAHHQEGFVNSPDDWYICQTVEQIMEMFGHLAARYVLQPEVHKQLMDFMATLRNNEPHNTHTIEALEDRLVAELDYLESAHQLTIALRATGRLNRNGKLALTAKFAPTGFNLVYIGYMMAAHPGADYELTIAWRKINAWLEDCPWQGADMLRWLIMGFQLESPEYWELRLEDSTVIRQFAHHGWHIVPVRALPTGELRATVPNEGPRITLAHQPGGEQVKPGSKVIVSTHQLRKLTPQHTPAGKLYTLPLTPATVPTSEQLSDPGKVFFADPHGTAGKRDMSKKKPTR